MFPHNTVRYSRDALYARTADVNGTHSVALVVKNPPANAGDTGDVGSVPGSGRPTRGGNGNPLQYSCWDNPMNRKAWQATVRGVAESDTTEHLHT